MNHIFENKINSSSKFARTNVPNLGKLTKALRVLLLAIPVVGFALNFSSCKEVVNEPIIAYKLVNNADSVYINKLITFDFTGSKADNITLYTGDATHDYTTYPVSKGTAIPTPYGKNYYTYKTAGTYTITVIAENSGKEGTEFKEVVKTYSITVKAN